MKKFTTTLVPSTVETPTVETPGEDPAAPQVGRWFWYKAGKAYGGTILTCVTYLGSNYAELRGPEGGYIWRVHFDTFAEKCELEPSAPLIIKNKITEGQRDVSALMLEVKEITARLGLAYSTGSTGSSLATISNSALVINDYKKALVTAQKTTLPKLFEKIRAKNETTAKWMKAELIPLEAEVRALEPAIGKIKERIFHVELYAGLVEDVVQCKDGKPADRDEKVYLFQRRAYMDEECLANYQTGGMTFKDLKAFDAWLVRPENLSRILPKRRCIVAFQVRNADKSYDIDRDFAGSWREYIEFSLSEQRQLDKLTFLYIRNGEQVFRLDTEIEFKEQLFPDTDRSVLTSQGTLYAKSDFHEWHIISQGEYEQRIADAKCKKKERAEARKTCQKCKPNEKHWQGGKGNWCHEHDDHHSEESAESIERNYEPFLPSNVHYDDIAASIKEKQDEHNRLVLVLQGLFDRSPVMHPHPPSWKLWTPEGFAAAIELIYDDTRGLAKGAALDFDEYRKRLNADIKAGTITVGQDWVWRAVTADEENERRSRDYRERDSQVSRLWPGPYGDKGPGHLARIVKVHGGKALFQWTRSSRRASRYSDDEGKQILDSLWVPLDRLMSATVYTPGDYRMFLSDPRTRRDYLQWAPFMLEAEEFHAGNRKVLDAPKIEKKPRPEPDPYEQAERRRLKRLREMDGKACRITRPVVRIDGIRYEMGTLFRLTHNRGDSFQISGIDKDGKHKNGGGYVNGVSSSDFEIDENIPAEPKEGA